MSAPATNKLEFAKEIRVATVDLETVCKYHKASELHLQELKNQGQDPKQFLAEVDIQLGATKTEDGEYELHHAYTYLNTDESILPKNHLHNLLYLVQALKSFDWNTYTLDIVNQSEEHNFKIKTGEFNLNDIVRQELHELLVLLQINDNKIYNNNIQKGKTPKLLFTFPKQEINGKEFTQLDITARPSIIKLLLNEKIRYIKKSFGFYLSTFTPVIHEFNFKSVLKLYDQIPESDFKVNRGQTLFRRLVVEKILAYLNGEEVIITPRHETVTQQQAVIIYSLLANFDLLNQADHIQKYDDDYNKAKFIRQILKSHEYNSANSKRKIPPKNFPELEIKPLP